MQMRLTYDMSISLNLKFLQLIKWQFMNNSENSLHALLNKEACKPCISHYNFTVVQFFIPSQF
jgi:hypothetical protein